MIILGSHDSTPASVLYLTDGITGWLEQNGVPNLERDLPPALWSKDREAHQYLQHLCGSVCLM